MKVWAYIFVSTRHPKHLLRQIHNLAGVVHADALFGSPDVIAIVAGEDIQRMDEVIDALAELPDGTATDSKLARWIDGVGPPPLGRGFGPIPQIVNRSWAKEPAARFDRASELATAFGSAVRTAAAVRRP